MRTYSRELFKNGGEIFVCSDHTKILGLVRVNFSLLSLAWAAPHASPSIGHLLQNEHFYRHPSNPASSPNFFSACFVFTSSCTARSSSICFRLVYSLQFRRILRVEYTSSADSTALGASTSRPNARLSPRFVVSSPAANTLKSPIMIPFHSSKRILPSSLASNTVCLISLKQRLQRMKKTAESSLQASSSRDTL